MRTKAVKVEKHGVIYINKNERLCCIPLLINGLVEWENIIEVEEAPRGFKIIHEKVAELLNIDLIKQRIEYY